MAFRIIWSDFAIAQLDEIYFYYERDRGTRIAKRLVSNLIEAPNKLIYSPYIGREEDFIKHTKTKYRFLLHKDFKIIYTVDEDNNYIKIVDIFHTRQDPSLLQRSH